MDSLDGFQPERAGEATRKAEEEQKVKVMVGIQDYGHGSSLGHGSSHGHGQGVKSIFTLVFQAAEQQRNTERLKELIRIKTEVNNRRKQLNVDVFCQVEKDIESLRNKKIKEMEELLEIKNKKERSRNELEELRLDVYREKNLLDSLRHQRASKEASLEHLRNVEAARAASR